MIGDDDFATQFSDEHVRCMVRLSARLQRHAIERLSLLADLEAMTAMMTEQRVAAPPAAPPEQP